MVIIVIIMILVSNSRCSLSFSISIFNLYFQFSISVKYGTIYKFLCYQIKSEKIFSLHRISDRQLTDTCWGLRIQTSWNHVLIKMIVTKHKHVIKVAGVVALVVPWSMEKNVFPPLVSKTLIVDQMAWSWQIYCGRSTLFCQETQSK